MEKPTSPPIDSELLKQWRALRYGTTANTFPTDDVKSLKRWLAVSILLYVPFALTCFLRFSADTDTPQDEAHARMLVFVALWLALFYLFSYVRTMISAYRVQKHLHAAGLSSHGGWQVVIGSLILNPYLLLGLWVPLSVVSHARRIKQARSIPAHHHGG